jgi:hypothetical protein
MNKKIIWGIILLVILVIGGYFIFNRDSKYTQELNASNTNTSTNTIPAENNANSSKTYSNPQYGFSIDYPQNYEIDKTNTSGSFLVTLVDKSKVFPNPDVKNLILVDARSAKNEVSFDSYIKKYPILNSNVNKPYTFTSRVIGGKTFYYTLTERFEGTLSFEYCILNNNNVLCFHSISNGVAWSDENLNVEADSTHVALKKMLESLKFNSVSKASDKSSITVVSPNGGEVVSNANINFIWNTYKGMAYVPKSEFYAALVSEDGREVRVNNQISQKKPIGNGDFSSSFVSLDNNQLNKKYKVKVCDEIDLRKVSCDMSDDYFTITN